MKLIVDKGSNGLTTKEFTEYLKTPVLKSEITQQEADELRKQLEQGLTEYPGLGISATQLGIKKRKKFYMIVERRRHIAKTISYRILSTLIGFLIMWWVSGSIKVGAAFGVAELIYKPIQYYIHERVWYKWIKYGLKK